MLRGLIFAAAALAAACARPPEAARPSILLVTIDTLRADHVGCYGAASARTPTLDGLAKAGVRFDEARSHVPLTAPSHATILTGVLPPQHGVRANAAFRLKPEAPVLAESLRDAGYQTAAIVGSVVLDRMTGLDRGFTTYDDNQRRGPKAAFHYLERGASQIEEASSRALKTLQPPFFLWVHFYDPHEPWVAPPAFGTGYDGEIAFADAALGRVVAAARARAGDNLVIAVLSDHGESLGEHGENQHGYTLHRGVLRVPLILAGPGIPTGATVATTIGLVDVAPTLAGLARVPLPGATGHSLARFFGDRPDVAGDVALWEETLHPLFDSGWAPLRGLLEARWHLVDAPRPELYDRAIDRDDRTDVAMGHGGDVATLRTRLHAIGAAMGDLDEPEAAAAVSPEDKERRERLAALGYASSGARAAPAGGRIDPKDGLPGFLAVEDAEKRLEQGDAAAAMAGIAPFLKTDPSNPRLWHTLGKARLQRGDVGGAKQAIERALDLAPGQEFLLYTQAEILHRAGDETGARATLQAILDANPRAVEATLELSAMAIREKDPSRSQAILRAAYDVGARDPDLLDRLGQHAVLDNHDIAARAYFGGSLELWPDDPQALLALGRADLRGGDAANAIVRFRQCTDGPEAFACRMELARAYVLGPGDFAAAKRELTAARELATDPRLRAEVDRRLAAVEEKSGLR